MTKSKTLVELRPCPFCGGEAVCWPSGLVNCKNNECFCSEHADFWISHERWNTRAHQDTEVQRLRDVIERCRDALKSCRLFAGCEREYDENAVSDAILECHKILEEKI